MSKAVLISIRPEWCEKIINGQKTIEVRKTRPKMDTPFKCYIYRSVQGGVGYGWHISNLRIYDHSRDLWEFVGLQRETEFGLAPRPITRQLQSWRYVEGDV